MSRKKYLLFGGILRSWPARRLVRRLRNDACKGDDGTNLLCGKRAAIGRHHRRLSHGAAAKSNDVLHEFVALAVQRDAVIQQRRHGCEIRAIRWARWRGIRMTPHAILIEDALSLSLLVAKGNYFRRIRPIRFGIVGSMKRIGFGGFNALAAAE